MSASSKIAAVLLSVSVSLSCQAAKKAENSQATSEVLSVPDLGFRYTPPGGMVDKTSSASRAYREHAASYAGKAAELLLDMSSGDGDTSPDWHQVWMFVFPRGQSSNLNDAAAERKLNTALAGPRATPVGQPQSTVLAGHGFLVSEFEQKEPPLIKHAKIYTTICKTQLLSFVFVSNSAEPLKATEESLKTLDFSNH